MTDQISRFWHRFAGLAAILLIGVSVFFTGMATMYWVNRSERMQLMSRFPQVRAAAAASATEVADAKYAIEISGLKSENQALRSSQELISKSVSDTHEIAAHTLQFLGDRAKVNDQRTAVMMKQTREATAAAVDAKQTAKIAQQAATVAVVKIDETAGALKSVDKKLETATRGTAAVPPQPWIGNRR